MRAVVQRVSQCNVVVNGIKISEIGKGLLIFVGIEKEDTKEDVSWLANKISKLRIFSDQNGLMNLSINDVDGSILVVSQFTLHAKTKKGTRPSFIRASAPDHSVPLYETFIQSFENLINGKVASGEFGAMMNVELINDGPVTIIIDTKNKE